MILGLGIDLVRVERIERSVGRWGDAFLERVFTEAERGYCLSRKRPSLHLAARFCVKEAVMKAFGTGWSGGVKWTDVEVVQGASGRPDVVLGGVLKALAVEMGVEKAHVSISHDGEYAVAQAILTGKG